MPAFSTHYLFARELLGDLQASMPEFQLSPDAVYYGTQGPDVFFFHRVLPTMPGKSLNPVGSQMHRANPNVLFGAMLTYAQKLPDKTAEREAALSYIYGFLLHYALDRVAHPYVYATQNAMIKRRHIWYVKGVVHNRVEYALDMLMLRRHLQVASARQFETKQVLSTDSALLDAMAGVLSFAAQEALHAKVSRAQAQQAFCDTRAVQSALTDRYGWKLPVMALLQLPVYPFLGPCLTTMLRRTQADSRWDYANDRKQRWAYPADPARTSCESFEELFARAKEDALCLTAAFQEALAGHRDALEQAVGQISFLTGLPVTGQSLH